jgi:hypothetical protein
MAAGSNYDSPDINRMVNDIPALARWAKSGFLISVNVEYEHAKMLIYIGLVFKNRYVYKFYLADIETTHDSIVMQVANLLTDERLARIALIVSAKGVNNDRLKDSEEPSGSGAFISV